MIGIAAFGAYIPRPRMPRDVIGAANAWRAPAVSIVGREGA
jgi:hypothetical protein